MTIAISLKDLRKVYANGTEALKGISLDVEQGDFFALLGPNGAGKTTIIGIKVLKDFEKETSSVYGSNVLVMNTSDVLDFDDGMMLTQGSTVKKQVHQCLLGFESSLNKVVSDVDCEDARRFITNIYEESRLILLNTKLSQHKKEYHQRVKTLTKEALAELENCQ